jgi:hypothetical protein
LRAYLKDLYIFISLVLVVFLIWVFTVGQSTIDIQLYDTYFVIDGLSAIMLVLGPLIFLVFLTRAVVTKFKSIGANIGLIIGLILIALITFRLIEIQGVFLAEFESHGELSSGNLQLDKMKKNITLSWVFFCLWVLAVLVLIFKTIRIKIVPV